MTDKQKLNRKTLLATLTAVQPGLAKKDLIEGASSFYFRDGRVMTYNDTIAVSAPTDVDGTFTIDGTALYKSLKKWPDEEIELVSDGKHVAVKGAQKRKSKFTIAVKNSPLYDIIGKPASWVKVPADFVKALALVAGVAATSGNANKPALSYVHVNGAWCEAMDGFRASRALMVTDWSVKPILVPVAAATKLADYNVESFGATKGWLHFQCRDDVMFSCRTAHSTITFPDTRMFFDNKDTFKKLHLPADILEILDRTAVFSTDYVSLSVANGVLAITGKGPAGEMTEERDSDPTITASCSVNTKFLRHAVEQGGTSMDVTKHVARFDVDSYQHVVALLVDTKAEPAPEELD